MSLYAVKNDEGKWLDQDRIFGSGAWACPNKDEREKVATYYGAHVVELVEAPAKVVVSEADAEILRGLDKFHFPASEIARQSETTGHQDRLMRAYVNGWVVEKPKRFNVKVPHTKDWIYQKYAETSLVKANNGGRPFPVKNSANTRDNQRRLSEFTLAEIEHYGLQDCEKTEVSDD